jgi:tRNA (pseudouridine54-N1)-methyltransferase
MNIIFFIKSATVDLSKYNIKDIPGSSGRLDVISRCILSALLNGSIFEKNIQIWTFLDNYGTYIFDSNFLDIEYFPKNEILLAEYFVQFINKTKKGEKQPETPLDQVKYSNLDIFDAIRNFIDLKYRIYVLKEKGADFRNEFSRLSSNDNLLFIVGDQSGDFIMSDELNSMNLTNLSLGTRSYLASSTIRLIKMNLQLFI